MIIEKATGKDASVLTELTVRSKSYWDYSDELIESWSEDLKVSSDYILEKEVYKLIIDDALIGYYSYFKLNDDEVKLENLFIEPNFIGKGYGKLLMLDFTQRIKNDFKKVTLDADPNAEDFYTKIGFKVVGKLKSSIKDRFLPIMEMRIDDFSN